MSLARLHSSKRGLTGVTGREHGNRRRRPDDPRYGRRRTTAADSHPEATGAVPHPPTIAEPPCAARGRGRDGGKRHRRSGPAAGPTRIGRAAFMALDPLLATITSIQPTPGTDVSGAGGEIDVGQLAALRPDLLVGFRRESPPPAPAGLATLSTVARTADLDTAPSLPWCTAGRRTSRRGYAPSGCRRSALPRPRRPVAPPVRHPHAREFRRSRPVDSRIDMPPRARRRRPGHGPAPPARRRSAAPGSDPTRTRARTAIIVHRRGSYGGPLHLRHPVP
jgi:hypothetical protein